MEFGKIIHTFFCKISNTFLPSAKCCEMPIMPSSQVRALTIYFRSLMALGHLEWRELVPAGRTIVRYKLVRGQLFLSSLSFVEKHAAVMPDPLKRNMIKDQINTHSHFKNASVAWSLTTPNVWVKWCIHWLKDWEAYANVHGHHFRDPVLRISSKWQPQ